MVNECVCGGGGGILGQAEVKLGRSEWSKHAAPHTTPPPSPSYSMLQTVKQSSFLHLFFIKV